MKALSALSAVPFFMENELSRGAESKAQISMCFPAFDKEG